MRELRSMRTPRAKTWARPRVIMYAVCWRCPQLLRHGSAGTADVPDSHDVGSLVERLGPLMRQAAGEAATLIPGALQTIARLRSEGIRIASSTGYTREMMQPVLARAAEQGYVPDTVVCSGETPAGRPSPLMIYRICAELGVWPLSRVVKVDDADVGIAEGRAAGAFTVGVATGNALALSSEQFAQLPETERSERMGLARDKLAAAGADLSIDSVADLVPRAAACAAVIRVRR